MSKYSNLPDIDRGVDVFETPDEPDIPLKPSEDLSLDDDAPVKATSNEGIDGSKLPERRRAEKVFGRARRKDGTIQYGLPGLHGDVSDEDGDELYTLRETPTARLHRLKREIAELESEMSNAEAGPSSIPAPAPPSSSTGGARATRKSVLPPKPPIDLIGEIGGLRSRITEVELKSDRGQQSARDGADGQDWHERLQGLGKGSARANGDAIGGELSKKGGGSSSKPPLDSASSVAGLGELDKRLAALEELVGPLGEGSDQAQAPLLDTVSKLDHLLLLLTQPRHLDAISRRVKLLLVDLDRAATAARRAPATASAPAPGSSSSVTLNPSEYAQLQSLFAILPRLDPMLPILPPLLARLRSLASLHAQAGDVAEGLRKLSAEDQRSGEEVKELRQVVEEVKKGLEEGAKGIERNWEALNTRMRGLEERIQKL